MQIAKHDRFLFYFFYFLLTGICSYTSNHMFKLSIICRALPPHHTHIVYLFLMHRFGGNERKKYVCLPVQELVTKVRPQHLYSIQLLITKSWYKLNFIMWWTDMIAYADSMLCSDTCRNSGFWLFRIVLHIYDKCAFTDAARAYSKNVVMQLVV